MIPDTSTLLFFGGFAVTVVILRFVYFRLVPSRRTRFAVQAVLYPATAVLTVGTAYYVHASLSWLEIVLLVLCLLATIEALWRRRTLDQKR